MNRTQAMRIAEVRALELLNPASNLRFINFEQTGAGWNARTEADSELLTSAFQSLCKRIASNVSDDLSAPDMARACQVNHKTVLAWCGREILRCERTPSRRVRIKRSEALRFMKRWGYTVPEWLES